MKLRLYPILIILSAWWVASCLNACKTADEFTTKPVDLSFRVEDFTTDTVFFDTVLTSSVPGIPRSFTRILVARNKGKEAIKTNVRLMGGPNSPFRMNVDGQSGTDIQDLEIRGDDSIFIFIEITVDPNNDPQSMPLIIRDSIQFLTNGNQQFVQMRAWGQDGQYFLKDTLCDAVWADKLKPYVIHDYLYVPEGCKLTIEQGVRVYLAPGSWIFVEGELEINGTADEPVMMEGDRLETTYNETPGQYGGIWLSYPTANNTIDHLVMKNGTYGVVCDSIPGPGESVNLTIRKSELRNMAEAALVGRSSVINAENCVLVNNVGQSFRGLLGGTYDFRHCTFAAYSAITYGARQSPVFYATNRERDAFGVILRTFDIRLSIANSIIYGSMTEEVGLDLEGPRATLGFFNNIIRTTDGRTFFNDAVGENNIMDVEMSDSLFIDYRYNNYHLSNGSKAIDIGATLNPAITTDFDDKTRDSKPDAGAFEF